MGPGKGGAPTGALAAAIDKAFGNFEAFKAEFTKAATTRFGSGWAWLVKKPGGALAVTSTPNQDNPLMDGSGTPILGLDVWEHAYYLEVPKPPSKIHRGILERRGLGRRRRTLRRVGGNPGTLRQFPRRAVFAAHEFGGFGVTVDLFLDRIPLERAIGDQGDQREMTGGGAAVADFRGAEVG